MRGVRQPLRVLMSPVIVGFPLDAHAVSACIRWPIAPVSGAASVRDVWLQREKDDLIRALQFAFAIALSNWGVRV